MKQGRLERVYEGGLLLIVFLIVLHAPISVGVGHIFPQLATPIKAWKELLMGLLAVLAVISISRHQLWRQLLQSRLVQLALGFCLLHGLLAVASYHSIAMTAAGMLIDLR